MEQNKNSTLNVAKITACLLIVSCLVHTASTAALPTAMQTAKKNPMKKNPIDQKMFSKKDMDAWRNPCGADGYDGESRTAFVDRVDAYEEIKKSVEGVKAELKLQDKINTTNITSFDAFNEGDYAFLSTKPTNIHKKWNADMQIYVATFGLLYKEQLKIANRDSDNTLSNELFKIFEVARDLLCAIEDFVNSTNTERITSKDWYTKKEMRTILTFKNLTERLLFHETYAKGRFQIYVKKLHDRITAQMRSPEAQKQPPNSHPKLKALKKRSNKTTRRPRGRASSKRTHIVRTSTPPAQQQQQQQLNNRKRNGTRRQKRTSTVSPISIKAVQ